MYSQLANLKRAHQKTKKDLFFTSKHHHHDEVRRRTLLTLRVRQQAACQYDCDVIAAPTIGGGRNKSCCLQRNSLSLCMHRRVQTPCNQRNLLALSFHLVKLESN
jgi:hypothetical protein